jgi:ATP-dependent Clp protease ATP-binding subunit ClpA
VLTQENINRYHTETLNLSLVLFDEIEKASDALWNLLLGILDKATVTLGDNRRVDFSQSIIFMTSNLGAREMSEMISGQIGFAPCKANAELEPDLDHRLYRTAVDAARRRFLPEFMNRIDKVVVFRLLNEEHLRQILNLELALVQNRIMKKSGVKFVFLCTESAKQFLMVEGSDNRYGARHLKRSIDRFVVAPLSDLVASGQISFGDLIRIDVDYERLKLKFIKEEGGSLVTSPKVDAWPLAPLGDRSDGVAAIPPSAAEEAGLGSMAELQLF